MCTTHFCYHEFAMAFLDVKCCPIFAEECNAVMQAQFNGIMQCKPDSTNIC